MMPLSESESRVSGVYKVTIDISIVIRGPHSLAYLRSASTTIKIILLNGAPWLDSSKPNFANPGRNGLYGKKPLANIKIAIGIRRFARIRGRLSRRGVILKTEQSIRVYYNS